MDQRKGLLEKMSFVNTQAVSGSPIFPSAAEQLRGYDVVVRSMLGVTTSDSPVS